MIGWEDWTVGVSLTVGIYHFKSHIAPYDQLRPACWMKVWALTCSDQIIVQSRVSPVRGLIRFMLIVTRWVCRLEHQNMMRLCWHVGGATIANSDAGIKVVLRPSKFYYTTDCALAKPPHPLSLQLVHDIHTEHSRRVCTPFVLRTSF